MTRLRDRDTMTNAHNDPRHAVSMTIVVCFPVASAAAADGQPAGPPSGRSGKDGTTSMAPIKRLLSSMTEEPGIAVGSHSPVSG